MRNSAKGSLVIVGTGIRVAGQMTIVTQNHIKQSDIVFVVIPNKPGVEFIKSLNPNVHSLTDFYEIGKSRVQTYQDMFDVVIEAVESGQKVCAAFYGHPGVFVNPSHRMLTHLASQGYSVKMEPGISAEDCLIADVGIDPAEFGCQSYEATQFLFRRYTLDPYMTQIIWQIWGVGDHTFTSTLTHKTQGIELLTERLLRFYPPEHLVIIYEAAISPLFSSKIEKIPLNLLPKATLTAISTLVIPSLGLPEYDEGILEALGISESDISNNLSTIKKEKV